MPFIQNQPCALYSQVEPGTAIVTSAVLYLINIIFSAVSKKHLNKHCLVLILPSGITYSVAGATITSCVRDREPINYADTNQLSPNCTSVYCHIWKHTMEKSQTGDGTPINCADTNESMIPPSISEISGCGAFCEEDLGILVVGLICQSLLQLNHKTRSSANEVNHCG